MNEVDAIVVGGGLAGSAFAIELARAGRQVLLFERSRVATQKVCGDFLSAEALELLAYFGIDAAALGGSTILRLRIVAGRRSAEVALPFAAAGLSRVTLDEALLREAELRGVEVVRGAAVEQLEAKSNRAVTVVLGGRSFRARAVALATGKHNLRGCPRKSGPATAFKVQAILTPAAAKELADRVQLTFFAGGYVGICRVNAGLASICWHFVGADADRLGSDWRVHLTEFARRSPAFGDLIAGATFTADRPAAISGIPFGYVRRTIVSDAVFPVGDQIAVIPPFTGDGTSLALGSGIAAARTVLAGRTPADYQSAWIGAIGQQFRLARLVNGAVARPWAARIAVEAVASFPSLAAAVARATRSPAHGLGSLQLAGASQTSRVFSAS